MGLTRTADALIRLIESRPDLCPACLQTDEMLGRQIDALFYESVNDRPIRAAIRRAEGFCRFHADLVSRHADALGTAIIMKDVLTNELRAVDSGRYRIGPRPGSWFARPLSRRRTSTTDAPCPLCETEAELEAVVVDSLLEALDNHEFATRFRTSPGLCVPHFRLTFSRCREAAAWQTVLETQRAALGNLVDRLDELARSYDYQARRQPTDEQVRSWRLALNRTSRWLER